MSCLSLRTLQPSGYKNFALPPPPSRSSHSLRRVWPSCRSAMVPHHNSGLISHSRVPSHCTAFNVLFDVLNCRLRNLSLSAHPQHLPTELTWPTLSTHPRHLSTSSHRQSRACILDTCQRSSHRQPRARILDT
jgi:hypothetical protein